MARPQRITLGGDVYHVLNRANGRLRIFRKAGDFLAFERILGEASTRGGMRLCGYCLMSNHWHLLLWPHGDRDLPEFMRPVTLTHTQRYHVSHGTVGMGHLYQGRYKSFPVQDDAYYLTALRYIEGNPVRAALVQDAGQELVGCTSTSVTPSRPRSHEALSKAGHWVIGSGHRRQQPNSNWKRR